MQAFGYVDETGEVDPRTVAQSEIAVIVNTLLIHAGVMVGDVTEENLRALFDEYCVGVVKPVKVTVLEH